MIFYMLLSLEKTNEYVAVPTMSNRYEWNIWFNIGLFLLVKSSFDITRLLRGLPSSFPLRQWRVQEEGERMRIVMTFYN